MLRLGITIAKSELSKLFFSFWLSARWPGVMSVWKHWSDMWSLSQQNAKIKRSSVFHVWKWLWQWSRDQGLCWHWNMSNILHVPPTFTMHGKHKMWDTVLKHVFHRQSERRQVCPRNQPRNQRVERAPSRVAQPRATVMQTTTCSRWVRQVH